jgi:hypothetical protein
MSSFFERQQPTVCTLVVCLTGAGHARVCLTGAGPACVFYGYAIGWKTMLEVI